jgi:hypothetical protein
MKLVDLVSRIAPEYALRRRLARVLLKKSSSYLIQVGWVESMRSGRCCRADGTNVPWMNYPTLSLLDKKLLPSFSLFEYGSGFSTEYYARRCRTVVSVEYDRVWFDKLSGKMPANASLMHVPRDEPAVYSQSIRKAGLVFDVVVVDGAHRVLCIKSSLDFLSSAGIVILDDSDREEYKPVFKFMIESGFREITLEGMKPTHTGVHSTTIFFRDGNCFGF